MIFQLLDPLSERNNSYYFSRANQQKAGTKIYSLTQCSLTVNECDWHILAGNDERINSHCLTRNTPGKAVHTPQSFNPASCIIAGRDTSTRLTPKYISIKCCQRFRIVIYNIKLMVSTGKICCQQYKQEGI